MKMEPDAIAMKQTASQRRGLAGIDRTAGGRQLEYWIDPRVDRASEEETKRERFAGMLAQTPSPYWSEIARHDRKAFPPVADSGAARMRLCMSGSPRCNRVYPAAYIVRNEHGRTGPAICADCLNELLLQDQERRVREKIIEDPRDRRRDPADSTSPTTRAQAALEAAGLRIGLPRLPSERESDLRREIAAATNTSAPTRPMIEPKPSSSESSGRRARFLEAAGARS